LTLDGLSSVFVFCDSLFLIVDPEEQDAVVDGNMHSLFILQGSKNSYSNKKTKQYLCLTLDGLSSVFVFCDSLFLIVDPEEQDAVVDGNMHSLFVLQGSKNSYSNKKTNQCVFDARRLCG